MLQPLNVAYLKPLKSEWRKVLQKWKRKNNGVIPKEHFPSLLKQTLDKLDVRGNGLRVEASRIYPFDPERVLAKLPDDEKSNKDFCTDSLVSLLKETRLPKTSKCRTRRKRIDVIPGRSVSGPNKDEINNNLRAK